MTRFDEKDIQTLVSLGLNVSQARIYLTLVSLEVASVKKIAQTAEIDRGEIYRQLEVLQEKALVEKILKVPNEYRPLALNEALKILIQQKNRENVEMRKRAKELLKKEGHLDALEEEDNRISIIPKDDYRKLYGTRTIENSHKEIVYYSQITRAPIALTYYLEPMKRAAARGVRWRNIIELDKPTDSALRFLQRFKEQIPSWELRFADPTLFVTFIIYDDKEMSFAIERQRGLADSQMLSTNNPQLIKVIKDYFDLRWKAAMTEYPGKKNSRTRTKSTQDAELVLKT